MDHSRCGVTQPSANSAAWNPLFEGASFVNGGAIGDTSRNGRNNNGVNAAGSANGGSGASTPLSPGRRGGRCRHGWRRRRGRRLRCARL